MGMTWSQVSKYSTKLEEVEVVKATEKQIVYVRDNGQGEKVENRVAKNGYHKYFPSREEANAFLLNRLTTTVDSALRSLDKAMKELEQFEAGRESGSQESAK